MVQVADDGTATLYLGTDLSDTPWALPPPLSYERCSVRRVSLATILSLVEDELLNHDGVDEVDLASLQSALADLHTAMSAPDDETDGDAK